MRLKNPLVIILFSIILSACANRDVGTIPDGEFFLPPTQAPMQPSGPPSTLSDSTESVLAEPRPTPTPSCSNDLRFVSDLSILDGTVVQPGESLDKRWGVENSGTCNWDSRYKVKLIAGPGMGVPVQQALVPALSGTQTMIRMVFIAPEEPGYYRSAWQAYDEDDNPFGDTFFLDIVVQAPGED